VVVSFGSVAASGGYWIATAGEQIVAEPSTITGSIGVFGILPSFEGALAKLGLGADGVRTTPLSGEPDLLRGISPATGQLIQMGVDSTYRTFLTLVSQARRMPVAQVDRIAQGRVWDGGTARQLGLVDRFGSLQDAISEAARRANIEPEDAKAVYLEQEPGFWGRFAKSLSSGDSREAAPDSFAGIAREPQSLIEGALADARMMLAGPTIQARCLECPSSAPARRSSGEASLIERMLSAIWSA
jgi:protease-4